MKKKSNKNADPVRSPRNPFDAARLISLACKNLYGIERDRAIRWGLEDIGYSYPIQIKQGWEAK